MAIQQNTLAARDALDETLDLALALELAIRATEIEPHERRALSRLCDEIQARVRQADQLLQDALPSIPASELATA